MARRAISTSKVHVESVTRIAYTLNRVAGGSTRARGGKGFDTRAGGALGAREAVTVVAIVTSTFGRRRGARSPIGVARGGGFGGARFPVASIACIARA